MEDLNFPICLLKMNLQCCEDLPSRVKKILRKVKGVYAITIDPEKGLILVCGTVEPQVLINAITKTGQTPKLYGYEKDPAKAKTQFKSLLKRYRAEEPQKKPPDTEEVTTPTEETCTVGGDTYRGLPYQGPPPMMMQMPYFTLPQRLGPPAWLTPGPRPRFELAVKQPETKPRGIPAPYPFDFYEIKGFPATDSNFRFFSDDHAQPCTIM